MISSTVLVWKHVSETLENLKKKGNRKDWKYRIEKEEKEKNTGEIKKYFFTRKKIIKGE